MLIVPEQELFLVAPGGYNSHSRPKPFTEEMIFSKKFMVIGNVDPIKFIV